jgi:hypothetical protein
MDFCDVPLGPIVSNLVRPPFYEGDDRWSRDFDMLYTSSAAQPWFYDPIVNGEKCLRDSTVWGLVWALSLYLETSEQVGSAQRWGKHCRTVFKWILCTWNGEILSIIDIAAVISV